jgi:anti-sigma regulatory factor (Ser/Thr protein kinase)
MEAAVKTPIRTGQQRFVIDDGSKVGEARRAAHTLANFELNADYAGKVAIAATELANNLLNHARGGELLLQAIGDPEQPVIELLAIDRGPGMADVSRCLTDGYSTAGTPGTGLGAIRRLACEFDIDSQPGEGTVVMARFGKAPGLRYGAINVAMPGEIECGDAWHLIEDADGVAVIVVDGLGHGAFAAEAAQTCIETFQVSVTNPPMEILQRANRAMSRTRGGAAACARINGGRMSYAGVGNINGHLVSANQSQGLVSHNGTLGMHQRHAQQFEYAVPTGSLLVMHSDGVSARWDLNRRPGLVDVHPAIIAATIYRDHGRGRDDATVLVVRP